MRQIIADYNYNVYYDLYKYDTDTLEVLNNAIKTRDGIISSERKLVSARYRPRNQQTLLSLDRLAAALVPNSFNDWMSNKRQIVNSSAFAIDFSRLKITDLYDYFICPDDYYLDKHGDKPIIGPVFPDYRDGLLAGICIRNISDDINYVSDIKYTFSNYGWYLYGYDSCDNVDEVFIVEGVFDAIAMNNYGYKAIALGCSNPSPMQLAMLLYKYKNLKICLDNDLAGYIGAYNIKTMLDLPAVVISGYKDIAECWESGDELRLSYLDLADLKFLIRENFNNYHSDFRDLRYN